MSEIEKLRGILSKIADLAGESSHSTKHRHKAAEENVPLDSPGCHALEFPAG